MQVPTAVVHANSDGIVHANSGGVRSRMHRRTSNIEFRIIYSMKVRRWTVGSAGSARDSFIQSQAGSVHPCSGGFASLRFRRATVMQDTGLVGGGWDEEGPRGGIVPPTPDGVRSSRLGSGFLH